MSVAEDKQKRAAEDGNNHGKKKQSIRVRLEIYRKEAENSRGRLPIKDKGGKDR